ncbi:MAG: hypothetical protein OXG04_29740 [Acidobacteria bacterium]|nr:hypothetical protein [Acidobacteriota bacterium]
MRYRRVAATGVPLIEWTSLMRRRAMPVRFRAGDADECDLTVPADSLEQLVDFRRRVPDGGGGHVVAGQSVDWPDHDPGVVLAGRLDVLEPAAQLGQRDGDRLVAGQADVPLAHQLGCVGRLLVH